MDVKAMAKSKRSHSQHHATKSSYPKPIPKASADAAKLEGKSNRTSGKKVVEKPSRSHGGAELPSNSDRYLEDDDSGTEDVASSGQGIEIVKPKSKGADFRYLISEARSQTQSNDYVDVYSSLDEALAGANQGFEDMLSVGGETILSMMAGDYFIVEDKATANYEASFLSLNLAALSEQLAKVDLAHRLFIEPDVLPPELQPHKFELGDDVQDEQFQNSVNKIASEADPVHDETVLREVAVASSIVREDAALNELKVKSQVKDDIFSDPSRRLPSFEASQAEAELDMLLDSLGEAHVPLSSQIPIVQPQSITEIQASKNASFLDDEIDNLLGSTSYVTKNAPVDDAIDDLLESTSNLRIQDSKKMTHKGVMEIVETKSSVSSSNATTVDDFDAWLETL